MQERDRFLTMFDRLVRHANAWIEAVPREALDWIPVDVPNVRFGERLTRVTIKSLYDHLCVNEHHWTRFLRDGADGAAIPRPDCPEVRAALAGEDFVDRALEMHEANMAVVRGYGADVLGKRVRHIDRTYSGIGFLWAMYAHRAYHLGNIDIYVRQADREAPDFFHFVPAEMA